jgi:hypothetical protein
MKKIQFAFLAVALSGAAWAQTAPAPGMTRQAYEAEKDRIEADTKVARAKCASLQANAKDVCEAEAKGAAKVSKAELEQQHTPSARNEQKLQEARADAAYGVAKERCDDQQGQAKDACVKQAKATRSAAKAQAKATKTSAAGTGATGTPGLGAAGGAGSATAGSRP